MILHDYRGQPCHGGARAREQVHDLLTASLAFQSSLDSLDLAANAPHSRQKLVLFTNGMRHASHYRIGPLPICRDFSRGLTTFSTFSAEVFTLLARAQVGFALGEIGVHLLGSLAATTLGVLTVRWTLGVG